MCFRLARGWAALSWARWIFTPRLSPSGPARASISRSDARRSLQCSSASKRIRSSPACSLAAGQHRNCASRHRRGRYNASIARLSGEPTTMRILLSNDDGYFAPGLERLAADLAPYAEITVVAPERDRSGASNSLTLDRPLTVRRAPNGFLFVNGTPTDCVHLAVTGLLDHLPDMVISGINLGANMGDDTIYSGTVAAATEGHLLGIPSLAVSLTSKVGRHFGTAAAVVVELLQHHRDQ